MATNTKKNNAKMGDKNLIYAAYGRLYDDMCGGFKKSMKHWLRVRDEQRAVNRYKWYNLPSGMTGQFLERVLFYEGKGAFVYDKDTKMFYFLPFTLNGTIDQYGRYNGLTLLPFKGSTQTQEGSQLSLLITGKPKKPKYDIQLDALTLEDFDNSAVILTDYTLQQSQEPTARQILNDPILDVMAETLCFTRTAMLNNTGVQGFIVQSEDDEKKVTQLSNGMAAAAIDGYKYVPINVPFQTQELTGENGLAGEDFLRTFQALDNLSLGAYGLDQGGVFEKQSGMTSFEMGMNQGMGNLVYEDGLTNRQHFCDIVNSIWDLGIMCEPAESVIGMDRNGDGMALNEQDQSGLMSGEQEVM